MFSDQFFSCNVLIVGSGLSGLVFAIETADLGDIIVLCKKEQKDTNTHYAQGGIAGVIDPRDSIELHVRDTLEAGAGLCDKSVVEEIIEKGPKAIETLISYGVNFDRKDNSAFTLGLEGGHSHRRILHSRDSTGVEIHRALRARVKSEPNISILENHIVIDLITRVVDGQKEVHGVYCLDQKTGNVLSISSRITFLGTGGVGKVYLYTSNSDVSTGDGIASAWRAGCRIANMEFIQFHPTCLYHPKAKTFLLTEALRGEGAVLTLHNGERFMDAYHPRAELAPRDVVARAIDSQMKLTGADNVFLDISFKDANFIMDRFPNIYKISKQFGFDMAKEPLPVVPAAHYCCGGVVTDLFGRTDLRRLFVSGETAYTGLHGANRLASNSLLEALVLSKEAAEYVKKNFNNYTHPGRVLPWDHLDTVSSHENVLVSYIWDEVRRLMWGLVGIVRRNHRLDLAEKRIQHIKNDVKEYYWKYRITSDFIELRNIIDIAELLVHSARSRQESRGLHYNTDYPELREELQKPTILSALRGP